MNEQDKDIKKLFESFNPEVGDGEQFMRKLENRMDSVEFLRESSRRTIRNYRKAGVAAALAGFACGVLMTLFLPRIVSLITSLSSAAAPYATLIAWAIAGGVTIAASLTTFLQALRT